MFRDGFLLLEAFLRFKMKKKSVVCYKGKSFAKGSFYRDDILISDIVFFLRESRKTFEIFQHAGSEKTCLS